MHIPGVGLQDLSLAALLGHAFCFPFVDENMTMQFIAPTTMRNAFLAMMDTVPLGPQTITNLSFIKLFWLWHFILAAETQTRT